MLIMMVYLSPSQFSHTAITTSYTWGVLPFVVVDEEGIKLWVNFLVTFSA